MAKTVKEVALPEQERVPTFAFCFYRSETNPQEYVSKYFRDGVLMAETTNPNSYIVNAAFMDREMRLAPFK